MPSNCCFLMFSWKITNVTREMSGGAEVKAPGTELLEQFVFIKNYN